MAEGNPSPFDVLSNRIRNLPTLSAAQQGNGSVWAVTATLAEVNVATNLSDDQLAGLIKTKFPDASAAVNQGNTLAHIQAVLPLITNVPTTIDHGALRTIITTPLTTKFFSTTSHSQIFPQFFQSGGDADPVAGCITTALETPLPLQGSSEMSWSGFYDSMFVGPVKRLQVSGYLQSVFVDRNTRDLSGLTQKNSRRDLLLYSRDILAVAAEDKRVPGNLDAAKEDLQNKNRGWDAYQYGCLRYILCYAAAGPRIQFYAMDDTPNAQCIPISNVYDVSIMAQRVQVLICFLNVLRWVETITKVVRLPDVIHRIGEKIKREGDSWITFRKGYVTKEIRKLSKSQFNNILAIYSKTNGVPNCIQVKGIEYYDGSTWKNGSVNTPPPLSKNHIKIKLIPVGAQIKPQNNVELLKAMISIQVFLHKIHKMNLVHRDLRWPNIIKVNNNWIVIDLERMGKVGEKVSWENSYLPQESSNGYQKEHDIYQMGCLIIDSGITTPEIVQLGMDLKGYIFKTASPQQLGVRLINLLRSIPT